MKLFLLKQLCNPPSPILEKKDKVHLFVCETNYLVQRVTNSWPHSIEEKLGPEMLAVLPNNQATNFLGISELLLHSINFMLVYSGELWMVIES